MPLISYSYLISVRKMYDRKSDQKIHGEKSSIFVVVCGAVGICQCTERSQKTNKNETFRDVIEKAVYKQ